MKKKIATYKEQRQIENTLLNVATSSHYKGDTQLHRWNPGWDIDRVAREVGGGVTAANVRHVITQLELEFESAKPASLESRVSELEQNVSKLMNDLETLIGDFYK